MKRGTVLESILKYRVSGLIPSVIEDFGSFLKRHRSPLVELRVITEFDKVTHDLSVDLIFETFELKYKLVIVTYFKKGSLDSKRESLVAVFNGGVRVEDLGINLAYMRYKRLNRKSSSNILPIESTIKHFLKYNRMDSSTVKGNFAVRSWNYMELMRDIQTYTRRTPNYQFILNGRTNAGFVDLYFCAYRESNFETIVRDEVIKVYRETKNKDVAELISDCARRVYN